MDPGDQIAGMLAVAVASSRTLEVLDLEGTGLSNHAAQVLSRTWVLLSYRGTTRFAWRGVI